MKHPLNDFRYCTCNPYSGFFSQDCYDSNGEIIHSQEAIEYVAGIRKMNEDKPKEQLEAQWIEGNGRTPGVYKNGKKIETLPRLNFMQPVPNSYVAKEDLPAYRFLSQLKKEGIEISDEILNETPFRVSKAWFELLSGYREKPEAILSKRFETEQSSMVVVKDIPFVSFCEHHLLPFMGTAVFGYIPKDNKVVGISKIPRLIQCFAKRLQLQERMTDQITKSFFEIVQPHGCMCITTASHTCSEIRGVKAIGSKTIASSIQGTFNDEKVRQEFLTHAAR